MQGRIEKLDRLKLLVLAIILGVAVVCRAQEPLLTFDRYIPMEDGTQAPQMILSNATERAITVLCCDPSYRVNNAQGPKVVHVTVPLDECWLFHSAQIKEGEKWHDLSLRTQVCEGEPKPCTLLPMKTVSFIPQVSTNAECRIGVRYLIGQTTNTIWSDSIRFRSWSRLVNGFTR